MDLGLLPTRVWQQIVLIVKVYLFASRAKPMLLVEREALTEQIDRFGLEEGSSRAAN